MNYRKKKFSKESLVTSVTIVKKRKRYIVIDSRAMISNVYDYNVISELKRGDLVPRMLTPYWKGKLTAELPAAFLDGRY